MTKEKRKIYTDEFKAVPNIDINGIK